MAQSTRTPAQRAIRRHLVLGLSLVLAMGAGAGGWAATTPLSGAVIAGGTLVVDTYVKKVQHPTGGVVAQLNVRNGSRVEAGDVLIRLDETQTRANLAIVEKRLAELAMREARLVAERDGASGIEISEALRARMDEPVVAAAFTGETRLFAARKALREGQSAQLRERIAQLQQEMEGLVAQIAGKDEESRLIADELVGVRHLLDQGLTQLPRVTGLEREATRLAAERGALVSAIAQAKGRVAETRLQILQVDRDLGEEVARELREVSGVIGEFDERRISALDELRRVDIRAPQAGIVHELSLHAADAVIAPGESVMLVVPAADRLEAEVRIAPQDIDQIAPGQPVKLRFSGLNQRTTPEVSGRIARIGADLTREPQTGLAYYLARIAVEPDALAELGTLKLMPGMPVEAFVQTGERTALSYLVKPLEDQVTRAFREE